jgi:type IV pilus assembly protein PilB
VIANTSLGFPEKEAAAYRRLLDAPNGLVLVVGPTGSGKSTTLYAGLQVLARDATRKVITIEDPIEYAIDDVQQTQVRPEVGFHFADAMRVFVREDPDVIMLGEIRDQETALEAMRASQTGHLVLSTLHCNDATDAVQRLFDLGVHPNSVASALVAVFAQRLARRICEHCRVAVEADPALLAEVFHRGAPENFCCFRGQGCTHWCSAASFRSKSSRGCCRWSSWRGRSRHGSLRIRGRRSAAGACGDEGRLMSRRSCERPPATETHGVELL